MEHDLVGALKDHVHSKIAQEALNGVVLKVAIASMHLQTIINHVEAPVSCEVFGHRTIHGLVRVVLVDKPGTVAHHLARSL